MNYFFYSSKILVQYYPLDFKSNIALLFGKVAKNVTLNTSPNGNRKNIDGSCNLKQEKMC